MSQLINVPMKKIAQHSDDMGVPFFFKQWGEFAPDDVGNMLRVGKKKAGRLIDGIELNEAPSSE